MTELRDRVALVTGVGRAGQIGHAVARSLAEAGASLVVVDRAPQLVAERAEELGQGGAAVRACSGDLTSSEVARAAVTTAREAFGGLDLVVNVAGGLFTAGPFLDQASDALERELAANLITTVQVCRAAIPTLLARDGGGGAIVNFASIAALRGMDGMAYYAAAKSAVAGLTRSLAREFGPHGLRVNAVAPITVRTPENLAQLGPDAVMVDVADVVAAVRFLAGPSARGVNGQIVAISPRGS